MKRLITKKAEFLDSFTKNGQYVEVYKNPTSKELGEVLKNDPNNSARGCIMNSDLYIWSSEILHSIIKQFVDVSAGGVRFVIENGYNIVFSNYTSDEQLYNTLSKTKSAFENCMGCAADRILISSEVDYNFNYASMQDYMNSFDGVEKVSRLIKNSEIVDGTNDKSEYMELFKNPTPKEIEIVMDESEYGCIRGLIYDDGTSYIWPGDILHNEVNNYFRHTSLDVDQFRFAYDSTSGLMIDLHGKWSYEEGKALFDQHRDFIYDITCTNSIVFFDGKGSSDNRKKYKDVKVARLKKTANDWIPVSNIIDPNEITEDGRTYNEYYIDYTNRDFAIVCLDGVIHECNRHDDVLMQIDDYDSEATKSYTSHKCSCANHVTGKDGKEYVVLMEYMENTNVDEVLPIYKEKYPNAIICMEDAICYQEEDEEEPCFKRIADKTYTWEEVQQIEADAEGRKSSLPFGNYGNFELKTVNINDYSDYFMTYNEMENMDLDEDISILRRLYDVLDNGGKFAPIVIDKDNKLIDGSHRLSALYEYGSTTTEAFVEINE